MEKDNLYRLIEDFSTENVSLNELEEIVDEYPYFQTARLLYTKKLKAAGYEQFGEELSKTAILCADRRKLFYLIQPDDYEQLLNINKNNISEETDRTETLLESYFESFGKEEKNETPVESSGISIPYTDYFSYLESLGVDNNTDISDQPLQHQDIIDAFISNNETDKLKIRPLKENSSLGNKQIIAESEKIEEGSEFLTETLAKIYIKQKKYDQALTIIKRLSLTFPKKSSYFADQIRFLEFLIINEKNK